MAKPKTTTRKPRARVGSHRRKPMNVNAVIEMAQFRNDMRALSAQRRALEKANAPWKRITAKLVTTALMMGFGSIVIAHAWAISS